MHRITTPRIPVLLLFLITVTAASGAPSGHVYVQGGTDIRFEVSFPSSVSNEPVTGRVFVILSDSEQREPRMQVGRRGVPFFGVDVVDLAPGEVAVIDGSTLGAPVESLSELRAGDYYVQALLNVYTKFERSDGHTVWMHMDQWEGQSWRRSPGNICSEVRKVFIDPASGRTNPDFGEPGLIRLEVTEAIPPIPFPENTDWVKRFRFQSVLLVSTEIAVE